jgi:hypothetical protein
MRTKVLAVRSTLPLAENRAECCQVSGHVHSSHRAIGRENRTLRRGSAGIAQCRCTTALFPDNPLSFVIAQ